MHSEAANVRQCYSCGVEQPSGSRIEAIRKSGEIQSETGRELPMGIVCLDLGKVWTILFRCGEILLINITRWMPVTWYTTRRRTQGITTEDNGAGSHVSILFSSSKQPARAIMPALSCVFGYRCIVSITAVQHLSRFRDTLSPSRYRQPPAAVRPLISSHYASYNTLWEYSI